jgi:hypothetical protein
VKGLRFAAGSVRARAETMRRAITETGLWQRLSDGIETPPGRAVMVAGMMRVYGASGDRGGAGGLDIAGLEIARVA